MRTSSKRLTCAIRPAYFAVVVAVVVVAWMCVFTLVYNNTFQALHRPRFGYSTPPPWTATVSNITHTTFQPTLTGQNHSIRERASVHKPASVDGRSPFVSGTTSSYCKLPTPDGVVLPRNTQYLEQCSSSSPTISVPAAGKKKKVILVYNRPSWMMITDSGDKTFKRCGLEDACIMTNDRRTLHTADAVFINAQHLNFPYPFEAVTNSTRRRPPQQMWVAFSIEPPPLMPQSVRGWENVFNWTMTYRRDSDIFVPYGKLSLRTEAALPARNFTQLALNKTKPVAWFVSNCVTQSAREAYVKELSKYIQVDVYGKCGKLSCVQKDRDCSGMLSSTYFFYLSFENSLCVDYVTEKLFNLYGSADVIPVTRGGVKYDEVFPANTLINTANFKSPRHLANHLHDLMGDLQTYTAMLRAKHRFMLRKNELHEQLGHGFCKLCRMLHDGDRTQARRVYPDFRHWVHKNACLRPKDL
ncbi:alpha-(1,3)-fucosyltransferase C-like [Littorina saxatilis]|uniref:Fucosyltransferase n=1 Tax=Littorina saxatilis TaxID=31220 RepID=A0AAN9BVI7_9CAEN